MDIVEIKNIAEAEKYLKEQFNSKSEFKLANLTMDGETTIDEHKYFKYYPQYIDIPAVMTRQDSWIRDDGKHFSITQCFKHNLEQVVRGEVNGPHHTSNDDQQ